MPDNPTADHYIAIRSALDQVLRRNIDLLTDVHASLPAGSVIAERVQIVLTGDRNTLQLLDPLDRGVATMAPLPPRVM